MILYLEIRTAHVHLSVRLVSSILSVFEFCVLSFEHRGLCAFAPGCGGERHEGQDAQERRPLVVLVAGKKQQLQIGELRITSRSLDLRVNVKET